ncbi:MAG: nuclear transport factor 2 family protein, partial [Anaerolineales bacterium]
MKKFAVLTIVLLAIATSGCGPSPEELTAQFLDAINSQDIDSALELISEDATLQVDGTLSLNGKAEIEDWLATQAELSHRIEGDPTASGSGVAIESCSISSHQWLYFGVNPMSGTCTVEFEGGLITSFAVQFDENSKARLSESVAPVNADLVGIWTATGVTPGTNNPIPTFLQFF